MDTRGLTELEVDSNLQFFFQEHKKTEVALQQERLELITFFKQYYKTNKDLADIEFQINYTEPRLICIKKQQFLLNMILINAQKHINDVLTKQSAYMEMKKKNPELAEDLLKTERVGMSLDVLRDKNPIQEIEENIENNNKEKKIKY